MVHIEVPVWVPAPPLAVKGRAPLRFEGLVPRLAVNVAMFFDLVNWSRAKIPSLLTIFPVRCYRGRLITSDRFKLHGCRFVPISRGRWRVVTGPIPRRFRLEIERGKKELKVHKVLKQKIEAKKLQRDKERQ